MKIAKKQTFLLPIIFFLLILSFISGYFLNAETVAVKTDLSETIKSSYAGEEIRGIKSLSSEDIEALQKGEGTAFGGMAKLGELNGYPGPRHVLDMSEEIELTPDQKKDIENLYEEMKDQAIELGEKIIALEIEMNNDFSNETVSSESLENKLEESSNLYGQLRFVHLKYHLLTKELLSPQQIEQYNSLRGYSNGGDPCDSVPEGHNPEMWKLHNNCI